jgi:hypothetical protein
MLAQLCTPELLPNYVSAGQKPEAEAGGFEPPVPLGTLAFKASAFGRSATLPYRSVTNRVVLDTAGAFRATQTAGAR